jgi:hypothetical protein
MITVTIKIKTDNDAFQGDDKFVEEVSRLLRVAIARAEPEPSKSWVGEVSHARIHHHL